MRALLLLFVLFIIAVPLQAYDRSLTDFDSPLKSSNFTCTSNSECHNGGHCQDGSCFCEQFYSGTTCEGRWWDDKAWFIGWVIYGIYEVILQLACTVFAGHDLFVTIRHFNAGGWSKWTLTTYMHILAVIAGTFRVVNFSIDPHASRGILHPIANVLLFNIPILLWECMGFMILLYWVELQSSTGIQKLVFISKMKPVLIGVVIVSVVVMFPVIFWLAITGTALASAVYNALMSLVCIVLVIGLSFTGINLVRVLKTTWNSISGRDKMNQFLQNMLYYILILDAILIALALTLAIFTALGAKYKPTLYVILQTFLRTEEFGVVFSTLIFTRKKDSYKTKPSLQKSESAGSFASFRKNSLVYSNTNTAVTLESYSEFQPKPSQDEPDVETVPNA